MSPCGKTGIEIVVVRSRASGSGTQHEEARAVDGHMNHLQRREAMHPGELEKERAPPPVLLSKQKHLLIRSDQA
jgi:hypothetical protein